MFSILTASVCKIGIANSLCDVFSLMTPQGFWVNYSAVKAKTVETGGRQVIFAMNSQLNFLLLRWNENSDICGRSPNRIITTVRPFLDWWRRGEILLK